MSKCARHCTKDFSDINLQQPYEEWDYHLHFIDEEMKPENLDIEPEFEPRSFRL